MRPTSLSLALMALLALCQLSVVPVEARTLAGSRRSLLKKSAAERAHERLEKQQLAAMQAQQDLLNAQGNAVHQQQAAEQLHEQQQTAIKQAAREAKQLAKQEQRRAEKAAQDQAVAEQQAALQASAQEANDRAAKEARKAEREAKKLERERKRAEKAAAEQAAQAEQEAQQALDEANQRVDAAAAEATAAHDATAASATDGGDQEGSKSERQADEGAELMAASIASADTSTDASTGTSTDDSSTSDGSSSGSSSGDPIWGLETGYSSGGGGGTVRATYHYYAPQYETSSLYCADEFNKFLPVGPDHWLLQYPWVAYCGDLGPMSQDKCGKCLEVTNVATGASVKTRVVDLCGFDGVDMDPKGFNAIDTNKNGVRDGNMNVRLSWC
ncbi:hypothetical protein D9Q98_009606 [Chlorella vulgaris]|uniref:Barwin domain-containing protein n=1 Tax=Chlorella vulgaris TaxID=3077 RepID=A0A9D4TFJ3_CHLVU|nr:hypothetical protein D9Q98_009606 [Chlorella vulgaris]